MTTLTATAIISAIDRASPVFARVGAAAQAVAGRYNAIAAGAAGAARAVTGTFALPAIAGLTALISRTQDFNRALVGIDVAGIADKARSQELSEHAWAAECRQRLISVAYDLADSRHGLCIHALLALLFGSGRLAADIRDRVRLARLHRANIDLGTRPGLPPCGRDGVAVVRAGEGYECALAVAITEQPQRLVER
jgi:hypothetical protein